MLPERNDLSARLLPNLEEGAGASAALCDVCRSVPAINIHVHDHRIHGTCGRCERMLLEMWQRASQSRTRFT